MAKKSQVDFWIEAANDQAGYEKFSRPNAAWPGSRLLVFNREAVMVKRVPRTVVADVANGWLKAEEV